MCRGRGESPDDDAIVTHPGHVFTSAAGWRHLSDRLLLSRQQDSRAVSLA